MKTSRLQDLIDLVYDRKDKAEAEANAIDNMGNQAANQVQLDAEAAGCREKASEYLMIAEALIEIRNAVARVAT